MEPPTSPKPAEITLTPLPEQQQHKEERAQSPVSKRRKVEHKVVITVKVEENSGKHKNDGPPSDFWSWRKYGQKPIKGSPYPRGYYRCSTSKGCSAKKQVERCRTDASVLIITYTSSHNHAGPDLQHISPSSAVTTDHKPLDEIKTEEVPPPPSPNSWNNNHHEDPNTHQSSSFSATATRQELPDNGNTEVASHLNFQSSSCVGASPDLPQANCSATEAEAEDKPLEERCEASPENPTPSDDDHACKCDQMSCCATPTEDKFLAVTCSSDEDARPTSTDVSSGPEPGTKVSETNLNSEDPLCSKPTPTASPICQGEQFNCENAAGEEPRPPSPLKHSPKDIFAIEKPTDADTNHILQSKEIPFDEGSSAEALSCAQTGLSPEEFDFYDELEELPSISPWTSILMGSFFDERILLPS